MTAKRPEPTSPNTRRCGFYQDPKATLVFAVSPPAEGLPTTILYDAHGRERARVSGGADWSGPDARAVIEALLAEK